MANLTALPLAGTVGSERRLIEQFVRKILKELKFSIVFYDINQFLGMFYGCAG